MKWNGKMDHLIMENLFSKRLIFKGPQEQVPSMLWSGESVVEATHFVHAAIIDQ